MRLLGRCSRFVLPILWSASSPLPASAEEAFIAKAGIPGGLSAAGQVLIAIIDDGVRMDHEEIQPFIWSNPGEVPGNGFDDDGNGCADDLHGWDFGDRDSNPGPASGNLQQFYHGTHLAGIIAQIGTKAYGAEAPRHLRIVPVKSLPDDSQNMQLTNGFEGIAYAIAIGADIILCSWGVHAVSEEQKAILAKALEADVLIVASGGSINEEKEQFPAAHAAALAVSGHDSLGKKLQQATFGEFVDLTAPAEDILAASSTDPTGRAAYSGSSQAAAIVAAAAAILKLQRPDYSNAEIRAALMNSATTTTQNPGFNGKLGAGKLNLRRALETGYQLGSPTILKSKGTIPIDLAKEAAWTIGPIDHVEGFRFEPLPRAGGAVSGYLEVSSSDADSAATRSWPLAELPAQVFQAGQSATLTFRPSDPASSGELLLGFSALPVDLSTLHCEGLVPLYAEGLIEDGSSADPYSPGTSCKWQITAPEGKVVRLDFLEFDTEYLVDKVYLFNGRGTHEPIMAIFTGSELPPTLTSWSNEVLVWFVTDGQNQRQGWKLAFEFVDP